MAKSQKTLENTVCSSPSLADYIIDVNVCRNPGCPNFGLSQDDVALSKQRYHFSSQKNGKISFSCQCCGQMSKTYSNLSVAEAFHRCLQNSIPFASCPEKTCKNHYVNIYENFQGPLKESSQQPYRY